MTRMHYRLELRETASSTGYFAPIPGDSIGLTDGLAYLRDHPFDEFMHNHVLGIIGTMDLEAASGLVDANAGEDSIVLSLMLEAALLFDHLKPIRQRFKHRDANVLAKTTPLVYLRSECLADQALHRQWAGLFRANMMRHRPLPPPEKTGLTFPVEGVDGRDAAIPNASHLKAIVDASLSGMNCPGAPRQPLKKTIDRALERLEALDILEGDEMRHQSSLSPIALLRKWRFNQQVESGTMAYRLSGVQTSYGRGISLETARASCLMEVVERCSSFAGIKDAAVSGTQRAHPLIHGSRRQLAADGFPVLDLNGLGLEVPYQNEPLYWMEGERLTPVGSESVWVPVQCVYLFCNLDEPALFSGLGSTGLASGNTMAEARLSALYELLERDSEAIHPFHPSRCFRVYAEDPQINALFQDYRARGIHIQFQDISPAFGIPSCSCFVTHRDGTVARGGGANLNGKRAVLSALTETPYPYPAGPPSAPASPDLAWLQFEALPDFSTGTPAKDLDLVEQTLMANGFFPIYVEITRADLQIPVTRALIPGFETMTDFDRTCRINPRLFNNYLKIHKNQ